MVTTRHGHLRNSQQDPAVLGADIMLVIFSHLPCRDVAAAAQVSKHWRALADDDSIWHRLCKGLWESKVYAPLAGASGAGLKWKQRYVQSLADSRRTHISEEELCTFRWTFRFKQTAGRFWTDLDPYWNQQGEMMRRFFHLGGALCAAPDDPLWGEHENRWRFTKSQGKVKGRFVMVNRWPSLSISRLEDWGWRMENQWVVYQAELAGGGPYCHGLIADKHLA